MTGGRAGLVHGMGRDPVAPDWSALTDAEVQAMLGGYRAAAGAAVVTWRSPRPMSAAGLVCRGPGPAVFVKRHHVTVRTTAQLTTEHALAGYLRLRGVPVPAVLRGAGGATVAERGPWRYEVHELAAGADLYRDVLSWLPYAGPDHARAAGAALARLHLAAAACPLPERAPAALTGSCAVLATPGAATDLPGAVAAFAAGLPALTGYLGARQWSADLHRALSPLAERAAPAVAALPRQWGHGDWHPSNLTWAVDGPDAEVAGVLDLSLANRTSAVHDLATAVERACVSWLDLPESGTATADLDAARALLAGYESVRPLTGLEAAALPDVLPLVHLEYALTEIEYFAGVVASPANADLAYDGYLLGHARWFTTPEGRRLLACLRRRG